jgi:hypothetical protein
MAWTCERHDLLEIVLPEPVATDKSTDWVQVAMTDEPPSSVVLDVIHRQRKVRPDDGAPGNHGNKL